MMLQRLVKQLPTFGLQRRIFSEQTRGRFDRIVASADNFLDQYCEYREINVVQVADAYQEFQNQYSQDLKLFNDLDRYESLCRDSVTISREDYDIALILSVTISIPRCEIMKSISDFESGKQLVVVGVGSGLELSFLREGCDIHAYDVSLSEFPKARFSSVSFHACEYACLEEKRDGFLAIELLEHIEQPFSLLRLLAESLRGGGRGLFTTAYNLPQFDHVYNFENERQVDSFIEEQGCRLVDKKVLLHRYLNFTKEANNIVWTIVKGVAGTRV